MPTLKGGYHTKDGARVPSVTTILSRFKESGGLIHWAWKLGTEGKDYREVRDSAADAGTLAHAAVEAYIKGLEPHFDADDHEVSKKARTAFEAFLRWAEQTNFRVTHQEIPLVSEAHRYGGTFDAILVDGKRVMGDWKTSNAIYPEYPVQLCAYQMLWDEHHPDETIDGGYLLLRFDKEFGDFHLHYWHELEAGKRAFLGMRALYDDLAELKKRVK